MAVPEFLAQESELPPPSAELVLWRVHVEAMVVALGRKKGERYLRLMADKLAFEDGLASVFQIRPASMHADVRRTRRQAASVFERYMPIFLAALPPK